MAKTFKPLTEREIVAAIERGLASCSGEGGSKLSRERQQVIEYYHGEKPGENQKGRSRYVSQDVWDSVEGLKAQILEVFSGGAGIGKFTPTGPEDVEACRIASEYTNYVVFQENDGEVVFTDVIHDGLTARIGWAKVYWEQSEREEDEAFEGAAPEDLMVLLSDPTVDLKEQPEEDESTGLLSGVIVRKVDTSRVHIESIPPEEMLFSPKAKDENGFLAQKVRKTRSDLLKAGFDRKLIDKIPDGDGGWETDPETLSRFHEISDGSRIDAPQEQSKVVEVYECYLDLDIEGTGQTSLWQVITAGSVVLHKEPVQRRPFISFVPLRMPHRLLGSSYAKKLIPTQNAKTALTRGILDHTMITNNPRFMVAKGGIANPDELTSNQFGGIVNVRSLDALAPMPQAGLNPFVFQTLQLLDVDLEDTSGVSRLSQGIDKDVISKQNSRGLMQDVAALSMTRQKMITRAFARFVRELYIRVYELVIENEDRQRIVDLAGTWAEVNPTTWKSRKDFTLDLCLGYGEKDRQAQDLLMLDQWFAADPQAQMMYTPDKKFALRTRVMALKGIKDPQTYLVPPQQMKPQGPDPLAVKQLEIEDKKAQAQLMQAQIAMKKLELESQALMGKLQLQSEKQETDRQAKAASAALGMREQAHQEFVDRSELEIAKTAQDVRAIMSPSG